MRNKINKEMTQSRKSNVFGVFVHVYEDVSMRITIIIHDDFLSFRHKATQHTCLHKLALGFAMKWLMAPRVYQTLAGFFFQAAGTVRNEMRSGDA